MQPTTSHETSSAYPRTASVIALVGGLFILLGGVIFIGAAVYVIPGMNLNINVPTGINPANINALISGVLTVMGSFGLVCGGIVLVSATMILAKVGHPRTWGILILVFSILSFIGLGGFVIGAILGIVGGVLVLRWKPPSF